MIITITQLSFKNCNFETKIETFELFALLTRATAISKPIILRICWNKKFWPCTPNTKNSHPSMTTTPCIPARKKESNIYIYIYILSWQLLVHVYAHATNQSNRNKLLQSFLPVYVVRVCVWVYVCISICVCIHLFCKRALWKRRCSAEIVFTCVYGGSVCMSICVYEYQCV